MLNLFWIFDHITVGLFGRPLSANPKMLKKLAGSCSDGYFEF